MARRWSFEGDAARVEGNWEVIRQRAEVTEQLRDALGIAHLNRVHELSDGTQVYVRALDDMTTVHVVSPETALLSEAERITPEPRQQGVGVPDYVSGAVLSPVINWEDVVMGEDTVSLPHLRAVRLADARFTEQQARIKLAIPEDIAFAPLSDASGLLYSQHRGIRPGNYTGFMRAVVQLLLGVGKVTQDTYQRRMGQAVTQEVWEDAEDAGATDDLPASPFGLYGTTPQLTEVKVLYDYRWNRTHGISWGADGRAYVVEIGQRGVFAMPLALDPVSVDPRGRAQYLALYPELGEPDPTTGVSLFDRLGGFPLGHAFPSSPDALQRLVHAGEVVEILSAADMHPFYDKGFYGSGLGWAFHPRGHRADNTCCGFNSAYGVQEGFHFAVTLRISDYQEPEGCGAITLPAGAPPDLVRKAARLTCEQAETVLNADDPLAALEELTVEAPFTATGQLREIKRGFLYHPGILIPDKCFLASGQPQFKVAEPLLGRLVSFDFRGVEKHPADPPDCDTPIFVCWRGETLTVLNYFWRPQTPGNTESFNTRGPCQFTGGWSSGTRTEGEIAAGNFYSSDFDPRTVLSTTDSITRSTCEILGYSTYMAFCAFFAMHCTLSTEVWAQVESQTSGSVSNSHHVSVAIPLGDRSVYYVATLSKTHASGVVESLGAPFKAGSGPIVRHGVVYDFLGHWAGHCRTLPSIKLEGIPCPMVEYHPPTRQASCFGSAPDPEFPFYAPCQDGVFALTKRYGSIPQGSGWTVKAPDHHSEHYQIRVFGDLPIHGRVVARQDQVEEAALSLWWWYPSPTACDAWAWLPIAVNRFGTALVAYQPDFDANTIHVGGPEALHVGTGACFVGHLR